MTYNLFATGLPKEAQYTLWTRLVGSQQEPAADALLNNQGKVVSRLADPERRLTEDPINVRVFAGKGEPKQFGLISIDGKFRAFAQVVPFPIEVSDGSCHLSAVMTGPNYIGILVAITGFQPGEELILESHSGREGGQRKDKATIEGTYTSALFPFVKNEHSGIVRFKVTGKFCKVGVELPWGEGSYQLQ